ncbi:hypothetical protein EW146_g4237 [Bondarzewia mesenterica]|uniref:MCM3-like winged helix domain-containing protein n=1 Tax=Bondarzewia mesenterica TaxID=1095465 RepID=A0A4S4LV56_9AGAM|nr:hypothetical protein EW146_g4237 [Bondarzewia mesenterica]
MDVPPSPASPPLESSSSEAIVPQKRKAHDDAPQPSIADTSSSEYESGRVNCETCGESVLFRDETGFTTKHWDAHKAECANAPQPVSETVTYRLENPADSSEPNKRRRAKRSEEERIDYLRSDPYVAQFEAYRVLCASCNKWIRLRPNSTYCSIPWDAHRKSCLAKKGGKASTHDEHRSPFSNDPDVKKFDSDRVHCRNCNKWIFVGSDDHSVEVWQKHRSSCNQSAMSTSIVPNVPPPSSHQLALASMPIIPRSLPTPSAVPSTPTSRLSKITKLSTPKITDSLPGGIEHSNSPSPTSTPSSLPPGTVSQGGMQEHRRRNADQRAAQLRADPFLSEVQPNRVFCSLCQKWVQLRQDSSYCAYPWLQHRGKCLLRHQKGSQKRKDPESHGGVEGEEDEVMDSVASNEDELESEDDEVSLDPEEFERQNQLKRIMKMKQGHESASEDDVGIRMEDQAMHDARAVGASKTKLTGGGFPFADLDSPPGRVRFISQSIHYLFQTTYELSDDMTVATLVSYLNSAMPPDKHEDFDTAEVTRATTTLHDRGKIVFEGDNIRLID